MQSSQEYTAIKKQFEESFNAREDRNVILRRILVKFQKEINSRRRISFISSLGDVLHVLERRNCLSSSQIDALKDVSEELGNPASIRQILDDYKPIDNSILKMEIYEMLVNGLGRQYRDFARYSRIDDSELEIIDLNHPTDVRSRIWKIIELIDRKSGNMNVFHSTVLTSLQKSRRMDLVNKLKELRPE